MSIRHTVASSLLRRGTTAHSAPRGVLRIIGGRAARVHSLSTDGDNGSEKNSNKDMNNSSPNGSYSCGDGRDVKVSVWWDFENCQIPNGVESYSVVPRIMCALRSSGIKGPLSTIRGYGHVEMLPRAHQQALTDTGVSLFHVPQGGDGGADRALLFDLVLWTSQNPPPAHVFLISGDGDFSNILHRLRMRNYNILLACMGNSTPLLYSAASIVWEWTSLTKGESLLGRKVNCPPDGGGDSWYHDALKDLDSPTLIKSITEDKKVPFTLKKAVLDILMAHPDGLSLKDLNAEIKKQGIKIDPKSHGYRRFSAMLVVMKEIIKRKRHISADGKMSWTYHARSTKSTKTHKTESKTVVKTVDEVSGTKFLSRLFGSLKSQTSN